MEVLAEVSEALMGDFLTTDLMLFPLLSSITFSFDFEKGEGDLGRVSLMTKAASLLFLITPGSFSFMVYRVNCPIFPFISFCEPCLEMGSLSLRVICLILSSKVWLMLFMTQSAIILRQQYFQRSNLLLKINIFPPICSIKAARGWEGHRANQNSFPAMRQTLWGIIIAMIRENYQSSNTIKESTEQSRIRPKLPQVIYSRESNDHFQVGQQGISAFPQQSKPFYKLVPFCLWDSFAQPHILYYLACSVLQYFKFCSLTHGEIFGTSVQVLLIIICMFFEVNARYTTYSQYTSFLPQENLGSYSVWNKQQERWEEVDESDLQVGQVIKVQKYLESNNKLNPVNLLPLAFASNNKSMLIKTTRIDKKQEYMKVKLLKPLRKLVTITNEEIELHPALFTISVQYRFISKLGSTFEAVLSFKDQPDDEIIISNTDTIPRGITISTEQFVIGVVLRHTESFKINNAINSITKSNKINGILSKYLFLIVIMNLFLLVSIFVINMILTSVSTEFSSENYGEYFYCFIINLASNLCNVIYIGMYILIYIQRAIDSRIMAKKYKLNFKNSIKSLDELAQTDTLIMDDYFFLDKTFSIEDLHYIVNEDAPLHDHLNMLLKVIEESPLLKEHMLGHTIPINKYFRIQKVQGERRCKIKILKEVLIDDNTIQIIIKVIIRNEETMYLVRFSDKQIASTIQKIRDANLKASVNRLIQNNESSSMIFFVEIMRIEGNQLQMSKSSQYLDFYAIFSFTQELNNSSLTLIKSQAVLKKYNVVILTSKTWKYINYFMEKARMKLSTDVVIALQEKQEKQMHQIIRNYRKTLKQSEKKDNSKKKSAILFLSSSMITYLSRKNIRKSIFKLSVYCKYIVFYNCSQYEKQISAVNLFKIFPDHIFLSNYICDFDILQYSNLSICERKASSEMLTTIVVNKYKNLETIIFKEAIKSIQIVYCIINSCTFKNQFFLTSNIVTFLLVYRGGTIQMGISYVSEIFFFYNFVFTIIPIVFMIIQRPKIYIDEDVKQYLNVADMVIMNIRTIIFGGVVAYLIYSIQCQQFVTNIFTSKLINSIVVGNLFLLFLDDSYRKKWQVVATISQIVISIIIIVMVQTYDEAYFQFVEVGTNFDTSNIWFYLTTFLIMPVASGLAIFAFSAGREIKLIENSREIELKEWSQRVESGQSKSQENLTEVVLKVPQSKGKQLSFLEQEFRFID